MIDSTYFFALAMVMFTAGVIIAVGITFAVVINLITGILIVGIGVLGGIWGMYALDEKIKYAQRGERNEMQT